MKKISVPASKKSGPRSTTPVKADAPLAASAPTDAVPRVGIRLKHARLTLDLNLKEVAQRAELTEGYLSKIERDLAQPSFAVLHRLVRALDMNLADLFPPTSDEHGPVFVLRRNARPTLKTGHRRSGDHVALQGLVPSGNHNLLQINIHVIEPRGGSNEPIRHKGEEFGYVLEGELELIVEDRHIMLNSGDCFYFDSNLGHRYRNPSGEKTRVLWVNTPPTF